MQFAILSHRDIRLFRWSLRVCLFTGLLLGTAVSRSDACTVDAVPLPFSITSNSSCSAQVTLSWDVSDSETANRALWELKIGQDFTSNGPEPGRADKGSGGVVGSKTIDLRKYGPYLTGQRYYFRIVAKHSSQDVSPRSDSVMYPSSTSGTFFSINNASSPYTAQADVSVTNAAGQVTLAWNLQGDQQACSDASFYEVHNQPFTSAGKQNGRLYQGKVSGTSGQKTFNLLQDHGPGTYYFRVVGKYRGSSPKKDIGIRAQPGESITIQSSVELSPVFDLPIGGSGENDASGGEN